MEWVSPHCFGKGNACWTLTTAWTMARSPRFIIPLSGVLYQFPLKTVSSSILIIPWCCAYVVLVKMPSYIWADFILQCSLEAFSMVSTVKCIMSKDTQYDFIPQSSVSPLIWSHVDHIQPPFYRWALPRCNLLSSSFTTSLSFFLLHLCSHIYNPLNLTCSFSSPSSCTCSTSSGSTFLPLCPN